MPHIGQTSTKGPEEKTDNEIIAEFMGFRLDLTHPEYDRWWTRRPYHFFGYGPHELKYHESWDWLMPVVEKIAQHVYETYPDHNGYKETVAHDRAYPRTFGMIDNEGRWMVRINRMPLEQEETLIKATYQAVVEFIKYYNQQPK
jgi:hypothetical protein